MLEFAIFLYTLLGMFVATSLRRNQSMEQPSSEMMTMVGWGLFSLSSTLAVLLGALALAAALGGTLPPLAIR